MTGIVFDLDGTLLESVGAICDIANSYMAELELRPLTVDEARGYIGNGAPRFLELALEARGALDRAAFEHHVERFKLKYEEAPPEANEPMPGSIAAMQALQAAGHKMALCTNKPIAPTKLIVDAFGWDRYLSAVVGGDSLPYRKPHPAPLLKAAEELGERDIIYVGDSEVDEQTAKAAGIPFVLFTKGYRKAAMEDLVFAAKFDHFDELAGVVSQLNSAGT